MAYFTGIKTESGQNKGKLHLYLHQLYSGPNENQTVAVDSSRKLDFGLVAINDWAIREGSDPSSKVVARAQGMHVQCGQNKDIWYCSFNIVFEDDSLKGSTLEVRGVWDTSLPVEWAIVGGTGEFTLAQGIVSRTKISQDDNGRILDLSIRVFRVYYRTI